LRSTIFQCEQQKMNFHEEEHWIESFGNDYDILDKEKKIESEEDPLEFRMFNDPDPYDTFHRTFTLDDNRKITLSLSGIKEENGQTLNSTGLTIWRASTYLCNFLSRNSNMIQGKRVLEVSIGIALPFFQDFYPILKQLFRYNSATDINQFLS